MVDDRSSRDGRRRRSREKKTAATRKRLPLAIAAVCLLGAGWWGFDVASGWWFDIELARTHADIAAGRIAQARSRLARLSFVRPSSAEVHYQLGICEKVEGRLDRAWDAWSRIAPESPLAATASRERSRVLGELLERGRFATLEELLELARRGQGPEAIEASRSLGRLLRFECRIDELKRLLKEEWTRDPDQTRILRELWLLDADPIPVDMVRSVLDKAAAKSPDDDRVRLGLANLATWSGRLDDADRHLATAEKRRPNDPAVLRARLSWARASGDVDAAREAISKLPADRIDLAETLDLKAWFAKGKGDRDGERVALRALIDETPGNSQALERLAALEFEAGRVDIAAKLREDKNRADRSKDLYRKLLDVESRTPLDPLEVAKLAESLGRRFEAEAWRSIAERRAGSAPSNFRAEAVRAERPFAEVLSANSRASASSKPAARFTPPNFTEDAEASGLRFQYENGRTDQRHLPETMGGGVGLLDYDGDGLLDVYCVQGGKYPPPFPRGKNRDRLFRNRGKNGFEDVTEKTGIASFPGGYGNGVAVGDFDGDGRPDVFVTRKHSYALYHNKGDGGFEDVTDAVGLGGDRDWPTSAAWADLDGDGDLDLYVCHYLRYDDEHPSLCPRLDNPALHVYCDPRRFEALGDRLFRNDGGRFKDVTEDAGITDREGRGLGVVAADLDGDRRVDIYVANDTSANYLFRNLGGLRFEEVAVRSGAAAGAKGGFQAGMGIACADLDDDGRPDLAVTNFYGESTTFYRNLGQGFFSDQTDASGLGAASRSLLGFGIVAFDYDNDGRLDLATAAGHVNDYQPAVPHAMPTLLTAGIGGGRMVDAARDQPPWNIPLVGRGLASGDLDNDGRVDLLVISHNLNLVYFHNRTNQNHSVTFVLEGATSNRDGVGAELSLTIGGRRQVARRAGGGSYLSASDPRIHFGLGADDVVDALEVAWPSGKVDVYRKITGDAAYRLREGAPEPILLRRNVRDE